MFLEEFEQPTSKTKHGHKQAKKEYSAGFRNYHPQKYKNQQPHSNTVNDEDLIFQSLNIGNLKELYLQTIPKVDHTQAIKQEQKLSIDRLTKVPQKQEQVQNKEEQQKLRKKQNDQLFNKKYHKIEGYAEKAQKVLFHNQFNKLKEKLVEVSKKSSKIVDFLELIIRFVLKHAQKYQSKEKIVNDQLLLDFGNFVNSDRQQKMQQKWIEAAKLRQMLRKNIFFYGFFDIQQIRGQKIGFSDFKTLLRNNSEMQIASSQVRDIINKRITVPYQPQSTNLSKSEKSQTFSLPNKEQNEEFQKFTAKPVPKTTYDKPKERPKSQMSKTQPQPFHLTNTNTNIPKPQDYYKWQRQFHARGAPITTYKPNTIATGSEDDKRKRALELLHSSKYPQSMKYLNHFDQYVHKKQEELSAKYIKPMVKAQQKSIPNFQQIHRRQIEEMEYIKVQNRPLTKPQPFNLSQPRPPKPQNMVYIEHIIQKQQNKTMENFKQNENKVKIKPKSTLKYDSYVNHLKREKEQKLQQEQKKKKQQLKNEKRQYKQLLKDRLHDQIISAPKKDYPQKLQQNIVKVNLQKIYQNQPLLIERQAMKSKKQTQNEKKSWEPII